MREASSAFNLQFMNVADFCVSSRFTYCHANVLLSFFYFPPANTFYLNFKMLLGITKQTGVINNKDTLEFERLNLISHAHLPLHLRGCFCVLWEDKTIICSNQAFRNSIAFTSNRYSLFCYFCFSFQLTLKPQFDASLETYY